MATSREHFALDWIKGELLETLNTARSGLESFAEALDNGEPAASAASGDDLRGCVNALHQVHGTLVMLELKGVTLLADHLERLADALREGAVVDVSAAAQGLMQGILELPGYLDELQAGMPDSEHALLPLVNELRNHLKEPPLASSGGGVRLYGVADEAAVKRFQAIDGQGKTRRIRGVYQQVLLTLLKGGDLARAIDTLRKVAQSMAKVCEGAPFEAQWQAFGEFVEALASNAGRASLDGDSLKLLRRVDSEIRELAQSGAAALQRPVPINLVRQMVDAARNRGRTSPQLDALADAVAQGDPSETMSLSGRQALVSAAIALREELSSVKDRLDLFVRGDGSDVASLQDLLAPLKQIASTLSLVGFESSKSIVLDQVELLASVTETGQADEGTILTIAGALAQVDENLAGLTHSGKGEAEKITDDAQRAVAHQTREGLEQVKQAIVDYVSSQWDVRHLQETPAQLDSITGALTIIPLTQAADLIRRCQDYVRLELMAGHVPSWEELDRLADALSGIDYYLERLASDNPGGAEDVLELVQRSLDGLNTAASANAVVVAADAERVTDEPGAVDTREADVADDADVAGAEGATDRAEEERPLPDNVQPLFGAAADVDVSPVRTEDDAAEPEPELELEVEEDFDLESRLFDDISGQVASPTGQATTAPPGEEFELELEADMDWPDPGSDGAQRPGIALDEQALDELPDEAPAELLDRAEGPRQLSASETQPSKALPPGLVDVFESDAEIVEIFSEEVDEVLATIDEHLVPWRQSLADETHQTEVRRAFHTLKGSGRMVGANVLGELAWSVENMLNRVLDGTVTVTDEFPLVVQLARELTPSLRDAYEHRTTASMGEVGRVMEQADLLASGGSLADAEETPDERAEAPSAEVDDDRNLFIDEARAHVQTLGAAARDPGFVLSDDAMRALHTLSGSAAMAGLAAVGELAAPAYELAQLLRKPGIETPVSGEAAGFFRQVLAAMTATLDDMQAGRESEDHFQLVAEADRLLVACQTPARADTLMTLPALTSLMKGPQLLDGWRDGAVDMALADEVRGALAEISRVAVDDERPAIAALAAALQRAHERFEFESLNDGARALFGRGHDALLAQFDALAADQTPADGASVVAELDVLMPETAAPVEDLSDGDLDRVAELAVDDVPPEAPLFEQSARDEEVPAELEHPPEPVPQQAEGAAVEISPDIAELMSDDVDPDIIEVFFEEADELLEALDQGINDWSEEPDNRLHLENLLRALHTLKGGARLSGLSRLGNETHDFESFLIEFQESDRAAEPRLFNELHGRYDSIAGLIGRIRAALAGEPVAPGEPAAVTEAVPQPEEHAPAEVATQPPVELEPEPQQAERVAARGESNVAALRRAVEAAHVARPAARAKPAEAEQDARLEPVARGAQEMVRVGAGLLENLVNLAGESSIIRARVEQGMSDFTSALDEMEITIERLREQLRRLEIETETQVLFRQERIDGPAYEDFDPLEMDRYSQLQQLSRALGESASDMLDLKETLLYKAREAETLLLQQARVNTELQEGLMRSRMVPFSRLVPRLKRTVRQVAKELGKDVELHAFNVEGELDRSLLERMVPPLEHMLRNAVDHGIEKPDRRRSVGKTEGGRIDLRLAREGGDVVIEIADDGAGIDVERVRAKAVERGLMAADADLRDDEVSQFVLAPGFSTAASVTQISGRGVGMDVVHSEVKQLGGSISIHSEPGRGTRFVLRVPFTVSVNRALMVSVGDDLYAIPLNTIEGIVLLSADELDALYAPDGHTFEYAGIPYRIQYLGSFLGREYHAQPMRGSVPVVLVRSGEHAVAVHVDSVQGSREIVVKSLGPQFAGVGGISGATILGDGSVVVILDLLALIRSRASSAGQVPGKRSLSGAARTRCVMVVDDSVTVRKVTSRLLERQGMNVIVAKDGVEAVSLLQEQRPDVMLLDIEMPRMDGFEVLRQVRHDDRLKNLPIVMISSRTGTKHQDRAADLGVSRFLGKPFQESELLATIDELVK